MHFDDNLIIRDQKYNDKRHLFGVLHSTKTSTTAFLHGLSSTTHEEVKKESHAASSFFLLPPLLILVPPCPPPRTPWLILLSLPSYLFPACRFSSATPPPCCVARRTALHSPPRGGKDGGDTKSFDAAVCGDSI